MRDIAAQALIVIGIAGALLLLGFVAHGLVEDHWAHKGVPPGYYLEHDGAGNYRPCKASGWPIVWSKGKGTKGQANRRAWVQYEFEAPATNEWKRVEE